MKPSVFIASAAVIALFALSPVAALVVLAVVGSVLTGQKVKAIRDVNRPPDPMLAPMPSQPVSYGPPLILRRPAPGESMSIEEQAAIYRRNNPA